MEPGIIDWDSIDSVFIEDETYESMNAPKWVDLSAFPEQPVNDEAWFCKPGCKHPKTIEDYLKSKRGSKVKFLKSVTISEMLPFRDRNRRDDAKLKKAEIPYPHTLITKAYKSVHGFTEDCENKNPNLSNRKPDTDNLSKKANIRLGEARDDLHANSTKAKLRTTFSARNLLAGKEVLSQITEYCSKLKSLAKKGTNNGSTKKASVRVLDEKEREKERMPLLAVKGGRQSEVMEQREQSKRQTGWEKNDRF
ncbi:uncharacterized protein [Populus alba]|uniref:Uncharacterized protein n=2 Tax=Populus TaxID=3689 RepID=A0A4U5PMK3_POPAL|nr:uncharacterized protein LOC118032537 [Populus alba]KAJ6992435.1 hypothetical protein NC653_015730 [Populus alba x Populus x berolinensis]TKR98367.1 hypothetical protein D5086_0000205020 [Populus alba]